MGEDGMLGKCQQSQSSTAAKVEAVVDLCG